MKLLDKENITQLLCDIDNIFLDCDGVIWAGARGGKIINDANTAVNKLKSLGKKIFLVTNSSVRTQKDFIKRCKSFNLNIEEESAICAPYIMAQYLKKINFKKKIYIIGTEALAEELISWGFDCIGPLKEILNYPELYDTVASGKLDLDPDVGAVAIGFDPDFNYGKLLKASCYLSDPECLLLGSNIDEKYPVLNTNYTLPAGGVMVRAVESASGRVARIVGKPSPLMFEVLRSKDLDLRPERTLMVGDTLHTDIAFGNRCGMKTLLVLTGVNSLEDVASRKDASREVSPKDTSLVGEGSSPGSLIPDYYLPSLGHILELI